MLDATLRACFLVVLVGVGCKASPVSEPPQARAETAAETSAPAEVADAMQEPPCLGREVDVCLEACEDPSVLALVSG